MKNVTVAILVKDGKVFLAKRGAGDRLANKWEFPGGKIEDGETPEECLRREMKEEFQIDVSVGECFGESVYHYENGPVRLLAYRVFWDGQTIIPAVHDDVRWVSLHELDAYDFAPADVPFAKRLLPGL